MSKNRLGILLHVVGDAGPAAGDLEIAPALDWWLAGLAIRRLPAPQAVDADALARRRLLAKGMIEIPDGFDTGRQLNRKGFVGVRAAVCKEHDEQSREIATSEECHGTFGCGDLSTLTG